MESTLDIIRNVIELEAESVRKLANNLNCNFDALINTILKSKGRLVISGLGKSGIIAKKMATTFASTGTPSFFVHSVEALHGDLGMLSPEDVVLLISYSGETEEVLKLIPFLKENRNVIVSMTGEPDSMLARHSDFHINVHVDREACPLMLAPTSSTTATLVMGDALAAALISRRGFKEENFGRLHPGGRLGKALLTKVADVMSRRDLPLVREGTAFSEVIHIMTRRAMGIAVVIGEDQSLAGVITDGDLRRAMERGNSAFDLPANRIMSRKPKTISPDQNLFEAQKLLNDHLITGLVVIDTKNKPIGIVHIHNV